MICQAADPVMPVIVGQKWRIAPLMTHEHRLRKVAFAATSVGQRAGT
jgi:hypothetical protein